MDIIIQSLPFIAAIALLVIGVLKVRRFLFLASFPILFAACLFAMLADGTSAAFNFIGGFFLLFGFVCLALSRRLPPAKFVSRSGLGSIGALFFILGLLGMMII